MAAVLDLGALGYSLILDTDNWNKGWKDADGDIDTHGKKWKDTASDIKGNVSTGISTGIKVIGTALAGAATAAAAGLVSLAKTGIEYASDLNEVQNVVDTTFKKNADSINTWSKAANEAYGLNELQAKKMSGTMGAMLSSMQLSDDQVLKMSESLTGLSADFASFYNLDSQDAFDKIRSGIAGETEPLKQLGINMSQANLEAFALAEGIKKPLKEMSQGEAAQLRYNYLMKVSADAQGDFQRTSSGFANQQRLLQNNFQALAGSLGTALLPPLNSVLQTVNKLFTSGAFTGIIDVIGNTLTPILDKIGAKIGEVLPQLLESLEPLAKDLIVMVANLADVLLPVAATLLSTLLPPLMSLVTQISTALQPVIPLLADLVQALLPPLMQLLTPIMALLGPIIAALVNVANALLPVLIDLMNKLIPAIMPLIDLMTKMLLELLPPISELLTMLFTEVLPPLIDIIMVLVDMAVKNLMAAFENFRPVIDNVILVFRDLLDFISKVFKGDWDGAWSAIKKVFSDMWDGVKLGISAAWDTIKAIFSNWWDVVGKPLEKVWDWVKKTWSGITDALSKPIDSAKKTISDIVDSIKGFFENLKLPEFKLPQIKMPHFKVTGSFSLNPPSVPSLGIDWYDKGGIFYEPSIIGVGEKRPEFVGALDDLRAILADVIRGTNTGGDTIIINSPQALSPSETARQYRNAKQQLLLGVNR